MTLENLNSNTRLAIGFAVAVCIWVASGLVTLNKEEAKAAKENQQDDTLFAVQVRTITAKEYFEPISVRAKTEANRSVMVTAEIDGKLVETPAQEGQAVKQGDVLCRLDLEDRPLKLKQAKSALKKAELDYQGALKLKDGGYQSAAQIASAEAQLDNAKSIVKASELAMERLSIRAPFDGVVEQRLVDAGAFVQRGSPCAKLLELNPLIVAGYVSESKVLALTTGDKANVLMANGQKLEGKLRYVSRSSDPRTRTFRVEVEVVNDDYVWAEGMSAEATVFASARTAHLIPPSLLALKDEGKLGIKIVESSRVNFVTVELLGDDADGVWVAGLPKEATLIAVGQEYVADGQEVQVTQTLSLNVKAGN